ncbi:MAG: NADH-quinone oxidoreductase subunit NuoG [bacterium]
MSDKNVSAVEDTITIEVDGKSYPARKGQMLIEVTDAAGIDIPRFCYHPKLSTAASCRMCLVDVEKAPKPLPACATPVMDGMKVFTRSRRSRDAQRNVMEFLLINHPLDCPVCDQGGECELQDVSLGYGKGISRFAEGKRVVKDKDVGPLVATEMTRCIHCTRCVRFLDEIAGTDELGGIGRGDRTEIGTYIQRSIDSELSGNIIDVCPVGALTNKVFRFSARPWELTARAGISTHDSLGSHLYYHTRRSQVLRVVPASDDDLNETWISDRDRFSFEGLNSDARLTTPRIKVDGKWTDTSWEKALEMTAKALKAEKKAAFLGGNLSNEEYFLTQKLFSALGSYDVDHRIRQLDTSDERSWPQCPGLGISPLSIENRDVIILIGSDLRSESPLLAHRIRKAVKNGAKLVSVDVEKRNLLCSVAEHNTLGLADIAATLDSYQDLLSGAEKGLVFVGAIANQSACGSAIRLAASQLSEKTNSRLAILSGEANAAGAWLCGAVPHRDEGGALASHAGEGFLSAIGQNYQSIVLNGVELKDSASPAQLAQCLNSAETVVAFSAYADSDINDYADILLPVGIGPEVDASYTNLLGQTHFVSASVNAPGESRPAWKVLRVLADLSGVEALCFDNYAELAEAMQPSLAQANVSWDLSSAQKNTCSKQNMVMAWGIYDVDAQVRHAASLQDTVLAQQAVCRVSPGMLKADARVRIESNTTSLELDAVVDPNLGVGMLVINPAKVGDISSLPSANEEIKVSEVSL